MRKFILLFLLLPSLLFAQEYYLAPWEWWIEDGQSYWRCPDGDCLGLVDLRSIPQMSKAGGIPEGHGFFVYNKEKIISKSIYLGNDLNGTLQNKDKIQTTLKLTLDSNTPFDVLWELLTVKADPTGKIATKPLMPTRALNLELHLDGQVKSEKFDKDKHPFVLEIIKNDYRQIRQEDIKRGSQNYKRMLDALEDKYQIDYRNFIPQDLPDEGKLPHQTTITEDWNCANADSPDCDLDWTETTGDIDIISNQAASMTGYSYNEAQATDLSSADHYSQAATWCDIWGNRAGVAVRCETASQYDMYIWYVAGTWGYLRSRINTVVANIASISVTGFVNGDVLKLSVEGSTLTCYVNGVQKGTPQTDPNITGHLRAGIVTEAGGGGNTAYWDNFEAGDLAGYTWPSDNQISNAQISNAWIGVQ